MAAQQLRSRTAQRGTWLRRRWRRRLRQTGPQSCCDLYCRRDGAQHVGRFSPAAYGLTQPAFAIQYPQGLQVPVDGVPTAEGPLPDSAQGLGYYNVPRSSVRQWYNLDWESTQQVASHDDWLVNNTGTQQVPDIPLDWSDSNFASCARSAFIQIPQQERVTTYGNGEYGDSHAVNYTSVLSTPGLFQFTKQKVVSLQVDFLRAIGDYSAGMNTINLIVSFNESLGGVLQPILDVPSTCFRTRDSPNQPSWIGPGHPIPGARSTFAKPGVHADWTDYYGNGSVFGFEEAWETVQVGFQQVRYLPVDRNNLHANVSGDSTSRPPWATREVVDRFGAFPVFGFVSNGKAVLRADLSGSVASPGETWLPLLTSVDGFTETGPAQYDPTQFAAAIETGSPKLSLADSVGTIAEIDLATQLPEFVNTDDTKGSFGIVAWPFSGDKANNDLYFGAEPWDVQFDPLHINSSSPSVYRGLAGNPFYFGEREVTFQVVEPDSSALAHFGNPLSTNQRVDRWTCTPGHETAVIPRTTWRANEDFCEPLEDIEGTRQQRHNVGTTLIDGVAYQGTGASEVYQVAVEGTPGTEFCRVDPNSIVQPTDPTGGGGTVGTI
ncbi:MAG: hypothetical protein ABJZ55_20485 [Fuerstiella sp.]